MKVMSQKTMNETQLIIAIRANIVGNNDDVAVMVSIMRNRNSQSHHNLEPDEPLTRPCDYFFKHDIKHTEEHLKCGTNNIP